MSTNFRVAGCVFCDRSWVTANQAGNIWCDAGHKYHRCRQHPHRIVQGLTDGTENCTCWTSPTYVIGPVLVEKPAENAQSFDAGILQQRLNDLGALIRGLQLVCEDRYHIKCMVVELLKLVKRDTVNAKRWNEIFVGIADLPAYLEQRLAQAKAKHIQVFKELNDMRVEYENLKWKLEMLTPKE